MNNIILYFFILVTSSIISFGQGGEANHWHFGNHTGINFQYGTGLKPIEETTTQIDAYEGCASISDSVGNLLFYTNGTTVWNANDSVMLNGTELLGDVSSSQSSIIIKKPGFQSTYYIFTIYGNWSSDDGFRYSEIDMNLDEGLGGVVPSSKNIMLFNETLEKVSATYHSNGQDIWVMAHERATQNFVAYLVTNLGIMISNPIVSTIGHDYSSSQTSDSRGYMKFSPNGSKLSMAIEGQGKFELYDFDNSTGYLSNYIELLPPNSSYEFMSAYGVEFSPDSKILYGSTRWWGNIFQWNLQAGTTAQIQQSCFKILDNSSLPFPAIQLGPDGIIYFSSISPEYLTKIICPNKIGLDCNITGDVFFNNGSGRSSLPNFNVNLLNVPKFIYHHNCSYDSTIFNLTYISNIDSVFWDFGDPVSGTENNSTLFSPKHLYSTPGNYNITLFTHSVCCLDTFIESINILPAPVINLGNDTTINQGDSILLNAEYPNSTYIWNTNSDSSYIYANSTGEYYVTVTTNCGEVIDSIFIDVINNVQIADSKNPDIQIFPNPANDVLNISSKNEISDVKIYNSIGELVYNNKKIKNPISIDISNLSNGIYYISIDSPKNKKAKLVILH